jgi:hypothetical protein
LHVGYSYAAWLYVILLHFSHGRSNWSTSLYSTTFQTFPNASNLLYEGSKFKHHVKLHSKCSNLLFSSPIPSCDIEVQIFYKT